MADLPPKYFSSTDILDTVFFVDQLYEGHIRRLPVVHYLHFLHLAREEAARAAMDLRTVLAREPVERVERDIECAFAQRNWRPHLMACIAIADGFRGREPMLALWQCMRGGSWVLPQLVATAAYADNTFIDKALALIDDAPTDSRLVVILAAVLKAQFSFNFEKGGHLATIVETAILSNQKSLDPDPARFALPWLNRLKVLFG